MDDDDAAAADGGGSGILNVDAERRGGGRPLRPHLLALESCAEPVRRSVSKILAPPGSDVMFKRTRARHDMTRLSV